MKIRGQPLMMKAIALLTITTSICIQVAFPVSAFTGPQIPVSVWRTKSTRMHNKRKRNTRILQWRMAVNFDTKIKFDKQRHDSYSLGLRPFIKQRNENLDSRMRVRGKSKSIQDASITKPSSDDCMHEHPPANITRTIEDGNLSKDIDSSLDRDPNVDVIPPLNGTKPTNTTNTTETTMLKGKGKNKSTSTMKLKSVNNSTKGAKSSTSLDTLERTIRESFHFLEGFANESYAKGPTYYSLTKLNPSSKNNIKGAQKSRSSLSPSPPKPLPLNVTNLDPSSPLTISDLQQILNQNGYLRRDEINTIFPENPSLTSSSRNNTNIASSLSSKTAKQTTKSGAVAFPQPTVVSNKHIRQGAMISSGFFSMLIATSIRPNLWLCGAVIGAVYGGDIAEKAEVQVTSNSMTPDGSMVQTTPGGFYGDLTLKSGRKLATTYFKVWDFIQGIYFMYRTGQLSYEYYKTYETLDKKFGIQSKMDAWNARFIEGKENFDKWEEENEVGRKVLAGLRTVWLVEENSYKSQMIQRKGRAKSKYRLVRYFVALSDWIKRIFGVLYSTITGNNSDMREIIKGTRLAIQELNVEVLSQRLSAAVAALVAINFVGALFAAAPSILGILAVFLGMIWPDWFTGTTQKIKDVLEETKARGRGERTVKIFEAQKGKLPRVDMNNFNFYMKDGKKQWYRTGQSFKADKDEEEGQSWISSLLGYRG